MITLDTSGVFALLNRRDPDHERAKQALVEADGPYLIPTGILAEIACLLETRMPAVLDSFLEDVQAGAFALDCGEDDLPRVRQLVKRYTDLSLGIADALVIAAAERNGGLVLTLDVRDFGVVAREGTIEVLPRV